MSQRSDFAHSGRVEVQGAAPGETPKAVPVAPESGQTLRIVQFGDKRVRVVGPDTPYAPTAATGT